MIAAPPPEAPKTESKPAAPPLPPPPPVGMEPVIHGSGRKKYNSSKVNLTISLIFHGAIVVALFYFAARGGMLGKKMKSLTATLVAKEKKPEPPKPKPEEPKPETAKIAPPKAAVPEPVKTTTAPPPPSTVAPPIAAPPSTTLPALDFTDGAKDVVTSSDPHVLYKGLVEYALRSRWNKPEDIADDKYQVEVQVAVDATGRLTGYDWKKGSGDKRWDDSVRQVLAITKAVSRPPPKGFPSSFLVRFDVEASRTEPVPTGK